MTKFVSAVIVVAFTIVCSASAMAEGWKIGNWEPPTKAPVLKTVALVASDWGTAAPAATVTPAGCSGLVRAESVQRAAACSGRLGSRRFLGWRIRDSRFARARMGSGHS